uniref:Reverse transcriptase domain-containing protein n=1 Tax=Poecilia reticulata TaxID=8081 RepID=A0A3P9MWT0_POERE
MKKQVVNNNIFKIRDSSNLIKYKTEEIQNCFENYYKKLYSQAEINNDNQIHALLESLNLPRITEDQNRILTKEITEEEIDSEISRLKPNKAPGTDGYSFEFYKLLRKPLINLLKNTLNWVLKEGETPRSWREAFIAVIPKEGKDQLDCANYRPVSVLNLDYRLFTAVMARRLEVILPDIIDLDQTGFIKKRQTTDDIRRTLLVMQKIIKTRTEAVILGLDAEKAFDFDRWNFLYKVIEQFGFNKTFIKTIQALYCQPTARVKINGSFSDTFRLHRGCRQGCSISPLLFAIYLEPLSQWIKQNRNINGIHMEGGEQKIALFADDVLIDLSQPGRSLPALINIMDEFGLMSGYKLNTKKT